MKRRKCKTSSRTYEENNENDTNRHCQLERFQKSITYTVITNIVFVAGRRKILLEEERKITGNAASVHCSGWRMRVAILSPTDTEECCQTKQQNDHFFLK